MSFSCKTLNRWYLTPAGRYIMQWEATKIKSLLPHYFGIHAIQLGLAQCDLLADSPIAQKTRYAADTHQALQVMQREVVVHDLTRRLPLMNHAVDLIVVPHLLERHSTPHSMLLEADRVLISEGHLIITGFNPLSLAALHDCIPGLKKVRPVERHACISVKTIKEWLDPLGYQLVSGCFGCYGLRKTHPPLEQAGDRWWPTCSSVYLLAFQKKSIGIHLVGESRPQGACTQPNTAPLLQEKGATPRIEA